ncbi:competence protein ComEC [Inhella inkyongensis]|uniref:Competence protein ComEC n=1 Tax=Inhella inkyongensis TaxID=392593 RepID=A0A840S9D1_9BURK|nr:DNA internalization-related competence protein ComEC/Rec2 [Inhella inkyongensis]MBB5206138.1 competence protein ComEC [Inhella inkyongensis]
MLRGLAHPGSPAGALCLLGGGCLGLAALQWAPRLLKPAEVAGLLGALGLLGLALMVALRLSRPGLGWRAAGVFLLGLGLGVAWANWRASLRMADALGPEWVGIERWIEAEVVGLPQALEGYGGASGWRLLLDTQTQSGLPTRLSLTWFAGPGREQAPRAGERWRLLVRLKPVHLLQNPGLPDAEYWLLERGVRALGSVRGGERLAGAPLWHLQAWREGLRERIHRAVSEPRERALLAGLALGDQGSLSSQDWALLRNSGVVHLFSVSGLHITGLAWLAAVALAALWRRSAALCLRWPADSAARGLGLAVALAYALLAGWGVPAQRTVALLALAALARSSGRIWPWPLALCVAAAVIGLWDPWALVTPGFWMSFAAVALLLHAAPGRAEGAVDDAPPAPSLLTRWGRGLRQALQVQALASLGLAPLGLLFFGQFSWVGLVANLGAVPLVTFVLTPLALLGLLWPPIWRVAGWVAQHFYAALEALVAWPQAVWWMPEAPPLWQGLALVGCVLAALRLPRWGRAVGAAMVLPWLLYSPARPASGQFELMVLDVGQGSAVWLRTATRDLLFDAGPRWAGDSTAGERVVLPVLRAQGLSRLDALVISHWDADHSGGAAALQAAFPHAKRWGAGGQACPTGQLWDWDGVRLQWLHPPKDQTERRGNASSCVLRVQASTGASLLLTADIEAAQERELLAAGVPLASTVLLLPHHGSKSSSSPAFVAAVAPRLGFAQAGFMNRHGHPAEVVRGRYAAAGVPLLTSADCGAWRWRSHEPPGTAGCWRTAQRRYWRAAPLDLPSDGEEAGADWPSFTGS